MRAAALDRDRVHCSLDAFQLLQVFYLLARGNTIMPFLCFLLSRSTNFQNICSFLLQRQPSFMRRTSLQQRHTPLSLAHQKGFYNQFDPNPAFPTIGGEIWSGTSVSLNVCPRSCSVSGFLSGWLRHFFSMKITIANQKRLSMRNRKASVNIVAIKANVS